MGLVVEGDGRAWMIVRSAKCILQGQCGAGFSITHDNYGLGDV